MTALICPECGEPATYRSCQQPDTEHLAQLALAVHKLFRHGGSPADELTPELVGPAIAEALAAREKDQADG